MKTNNVKVPPLLLGRPRYKGMIVPYTVAKVGKVWDFKALDTDKANECLNHRKCGMCGYTMTGPLAFIGGPESMAHHSFTDVPMHPVCARYAMQVCPFLTGKKKEYAKQPGAGTDFIQGVEMRTADRMGIALTHSFIRRGNVIIAGPWEGEIEWYARGGADSE